MEYAEPKYMKPDVIRYVVIGDFWDRSPCPWICDLEKLDLNDPIQKEYHDLIRKALDDSCGEYSRAESEERPAPPFEDNSISWYSLGSADASMTSFSGGRPDEVEHARVIPPCQIDAMVTIYYDN